MEIIIDWDFTHFTKDTKDMKLSYIPVTGKHKNKDAGLCISNNGNYIIASIHTGNDKSSNALCAEIVRRFNEFPEELKR